MREAGVLRGPAPRLRDTCRLVSGKKSVVERANDGEVREVFDQMSLREDHRPPHALRQS